MHIDCTYWCPSEEAMWELATNELFFTTKINDLDLTCTFSIPKTREIAAKILDEIILNGVIVFIGDIYRVS